MSTPMTKRPFEAGRTSPSKSSSPARTSRSTTPGGEKTGTSIGSGGTTAGNNAVRTRSIRSSTLVSGRAGAAAGAHRRDSSRLSTATGADVAAATEAQEAARAETVALLDDLKERLTQAESQAEQFRRLADVQQAKLDEALREQARLEERTHEYDEQVEALQSEKREMGRQMQQMETIYEAEHSAMTREKEDMANREEEMQAVIQRLKDSLAQRNNNASGDDEGRPSRQSGNNSPGLDSSGGSFAPPSSLHRSDSRNNSKLLLQKDKLIESLRLELAEAQIKLVESENQGGGRLREVERQLMEARMANARLMEDNESYQLLLQEKTLKGDFGTADFGYLSGSGNGGLGSTAANNTAGSSAAASGEGGATTPNETRSANQDALAALEGRGSSLADELSGAAGNDSDSESGAVAVVEVASESQRRLEAELKSLQDQNKALTLYINKIIERLLEHQEFQYILDRSSDGKPPPAPTSLPATSAGVNASASAMASARTSASSSASSSVSGANTNKDLPPPPASQLSQQQAGSIHNYLSRTKSMAVGGSNASRVRPRPASAVHESAHSHPDTAPSIPISLSRSTSVRRQRPMSEQYVRHGGMSGPSAASVINAMYKGPDGPLSPSFRNSGYLFGGVNGANGGTGGSGGPNSSRSSIHGPRSPALPALSTSGNFPGMRSETSSVSGDWDSISSPKSLSPPRQMEKTSFTGSKPRPLRLVQENTDLVKVDLGVNKRASWIGWAFGGKKDDGSHSPMHTSVALASSEPIQE
ncbi:m serotype protein [Grosmannia clavigera kw1407]|uniref:M serotype protein n=1 Tax=Grosmannia clavigera (strain kw1407 / UAMH 11150) TaxID=655863 RepID=F0XH91_GROCL|nr:m serotype protein [Grosmannia clavigera kw1407]EFX02640.1 m serotype protein [Grosmannia clavigera kw1407]